VDSDTADVKFLEKLYTTCQGHPHLEFTPDTFTIKHYAGEVVYSIQEFVFKNKDDLHFSMIEAMQTSTDAFVLRLFPETLGNAKQRASPTTSSYKIKMSAQYLVQRLSKCAPHYVRCIKPNAHKVSLVSLSPVPLKTSLIHKNNIGTALV